jgi:hypothetical protein
LGYRDAKGSKQPARFIARHVLSSSPNSDRIN